MLNFGQKVTNKDRWGNTYKEIKIIEGREGLFYHCAKENNGDSAGDHYCISSQLSMSWASELHMQNLLFEGQQRNKNEHPLVILLVTLNRYGSANTCTSQKTYY